MIGHRKRLTLPKMRASIRGDTTKEKTMAKDTAYQLRVTKDEKTRFVNVCVKRRKVPAEVLRDFMKRYTKRHEES